MDRETEGEESREQLLGELEELRRSERYFKSLIRSAGDMITVLDADLSFIWGSPSAGRITGYEPEEIYGANMLDLIHPDDIEALVELRDYIMIHPGTPVAAEARFRHRDGGYHHHEAIVTNLLEDPYVKGIVINSRDVSDRKSMEEELLVRNRELDAFASTISHDLRTPLSLIQGYAQLLQAGTTEDEEERFLDNILLAARRLEKLTHSLLEYAQAGRPEGELCSVDPAPLIGEVLEEYAEPINGIHMEVSVDGELPSVMADPLKLRQVFSNLVENAVKYAAGGERPRMHIGAEERGERITFYVRDNGTGIDPSIRDEVFLPFKRSDASLSPGLGIGLSTVKQAVEGWGGRVWVDSEPGQGCCFFFTARRPDR